MGLWSEHSSFTEGPGKTNAHTGKCYAADSKFTKVNSLLLTPNCTDIKDLRLAFKGGLVSGTRRFVNQETVNTAFKRRLLPPQNCVNKGRTADGPRQTATRTRLASGIVNASHTLGNI